MFTNFLLRLVARDAEAIIDFIERLRDKLSALIIQHAADIGKLEAFVEETIEDGKKAIAEIEDMVDREILAARTEISKIGAKLEHAKALAEALPGRN